MTKTRKYIDSQGNEHRISKDAILIEVGKAKPLLDLPTEADDQGRTNNDEEKSK